MAHYVASERFESRRSPVTGGEFEAMTSRCVACAGTDWRQLPQPATEMMATTAGRLVANNFGKSQCPHCGAVQKVDGRRLADTLYYEREYTYYDRPGAVVFDVTRYRALALWIKDAVAPWRPASVFDVGCGRGGTMRFLREVWPDATFAGIEPSADAVAAARASGFDIREGRLTADTHVSDKFELVFSNNVLQHTTDPVEFIRLQARLLSSDGKLVLSCPDGTKPNVELLMVDQNFSLQPPHLRAIAAAAGMRVERCLPCPDGPLHNEQLVVLRPGGGDSERTDTRALTQKSIDDMYADLRSYLQNWSRLDDHLSNAVAGAQRVFNFGGGLWSYALAAYCPKYWSQVECCLVDGFTGQCIGKEVRPFESMALTPRDILVLGTNPYVQPKLTARFAGAGLRAVAWNEIVSD